MSREEIYQLNAKLEEMQELFNTRWEAMIQQTSGVASDVKSLRQDFQRHMEEDRAFKEEMRPVLHGKRLFVYLADFMKYLGIPVFALIGVFVWFFKKEI